MRRDEVAKWVRTRRVPPMTKLILLLVFDRAGEQEDGRWAAWPKNTTLAEDAGIESIATVRKHLKALEDQGIIQREERYGEAGRQRSNRIVLLVSEDDVQPTPTGAGGQTGAPTPTGAGQPTPTGAGHSVEAPEEAPGVVEGARAGASDDWPEDLPEELREAALAAGKVLKKTALERGQKREVTRATVGHAVLSYPDRDHVAVAREVEFWLMHGKGARRPCADIVARYRNFLANSEPMAGPPLAEPRPRPASSVAEARRNDREVLRQRAEAAKKRLAERGEL
jgi:hypothetical protein